MNDDFDSVNVSDFEMMRSENFLERINDATGASTMKVNGKQPLQQSTRPIMQPNTVLSELGIPTVLTYRLA